MRKLWYGHITEASLVAQVVKRLPAMRETRVQCLGWEVPWRRKWNPLQYLCLENSMDGEAWWATVYGVAKSRTRLIDFTSLHFNDCKYLESFLTQWYYRL